MRPGVTVVIPAHPVRLANGMLNRALASVAAQTLQPAAVIVTVDLDGEGAAATRQRGLDAVDTKWVRFLDSDDELLPEDLRKLTDCAAQTNAVFVFSWFEAVGAPDPLGHFGLPFDKHHPHHTTMMVLCDTEIAKRVGFAPAAPGSPFGNEDDRFFRGVAEIAVAEDLNMVHLAERTWRWHIHGGNTCGMPHKGDARS